MNEIELFEYLEKIVDALSEMNETLRDIALDANLTRTTLDEIAVDISMIKDDVSSIDINRL